MRTVTFGVASSLDNFIARADGGMDWLRWTPEVSAVMAEFWQSVDAVVMGRGTYEAALRGGMTSYPGVKNYVVSRTLGQAPDDAVEVVRRDAADFVREIRGEPGKGICVMGGGVLAHSLLEAGVVDEIALNIHPVLLGAGVPLFHGLSRPLDLELKHCRQLGGGCVYVVYRVPSPSA